jgi:hypothetical protein
MSCTLVNRLRVRRAVSSEDILAADEVLDRELDCMSRGRRLQLMRRGFDNGKDETVHYSLERRGKRTRVFNSGQHAVSIKH